MRSRGRTAEAKPSPQPSPASGQRGPIFGSQCSPHDETSQTKRQPEGCLFTPATLNVPGMKRAFCLLFRGRHSGDWKSRSRARRETKRPAHAVNLKTHRSQTLSPTLSRKRAEGADLGEAALAA